MHIKHITIRNILGIEELEIEPGRITEIQGRNGAGKTSVIEAIKYALGGGTDATLIRKDAEQGEVVLVLDDGTVVSKRVTGERDAPRVKRPDVGTIGAAQTYLNKLHDILGRNPIELITADPKDRGRYVLEVAPMNVPLQRLGEIAGDLIDDLPDGIEKMHALTAIGKVHKAVFDERTGINREAKSKRTTADELAGSLPADNLDVHDLREKQTKLSEKRDALLSDGKDRAAEMDQTCIRVTRKLEAARDERIQAIREEYAALIDVEKKKTENRKQEIRDEVGPEAENLKAEIAALSERIKAAAEHANTREVIAKMTGEAEQLETRAAGMTAALDELEALKTEVAGELPLGLEVREDGEIYRDGIPFGRLNKAQQVDVAMRLSMVRIGELRFVCLDGLNDLDDDTYSQIDQWSKENDVQVLGTRVVTGSDLAVVSRELVTA